MAYKNIKPGPKNRVAIYVRVSTVYQIDKDSLPMQRKELTAYAKLILGTDDVVIFEDAGYSGKNTARPRYLEMMSQVRQGLFTHILVWKIDRISRNLLDFVTMYQELKDLGVTFISKNEQFDTSSAMGEAMLKIILIFAELERQMTSERVTATMIARANNGLWNGGRIPFGYDWHSEEAEFTINTDEYNLAKLIHDKYEEMRSLVYEARWLNDNGYRTRAGNMWSPTVLQRILMSIFYCGDYRYNYYRDGKATKPKDEDEWVIVKDHHPAIVTREQKDRIIALLTANRRMIKNRGVHQATKYVHVFQGLMICGNCGMPMTSHIQHKKDWEYSSYSCGTRRQTSEKCAGKFTSDPILGEFVFNYILNMLNAQRNFDSINSPEELQSRLLIGDTFSYIAGIEADGLNDIYNVLSSGAVKGAIYGKSVKAKTSNKQAASELNTLRKQKQKLERALERLTNLYLFSEDTMSEADYIIQKTKLVDQIDELNDQIGYIVSDEWQSSVSDDEFIQRASEFIIAQKLTDRNYIYYKNLAKSVDREVLKTFVRSIIDSIIMDKGKVRQIIFKNGLSHKFIFKEEQA